MRTRPSERRAAVPGRAGVLAAAVLAGSCTLPIVGEPPSGSAVRGSAVGVIVPVALELRADGDSETLFVARDGTFVFETRLDPGTSYTVALVNPDLPCTLRNETGVSDSEGAAIELTCTGASLASMAVSGIAPAVAIVPGSTSYLIALPLLQQSVTLTATVAVAGDTLAIAGTPVASGAPSAEIMLSLGDNPVDIVVQNALGWQRTYRVTLRRADRIAQYAYGKASNTGREDYFGFCMALSGDTLAVAAVNESSTARGVDGGPDNNFAYQSGAVYVFRRRGMAWQQEAYLKASNTGARDKFGTSVALSGDTLAVGAVQEDSAARGVNGNQDDNSAVDSGAVYVFRRTGTTWQQEAYLKASNAGGDDQFGSSVALSSDTLAVGAWRESSAATGVGGNQDDDSAQFSGAVYVFRRTGTTWQQEAYLKASNTGVDDRFGYRVALSGNTLAVGAYLEDSAARGVDGNQDDDSAQNSGAVYVFRYSGAAWQQEAYLKASNTGLGSLFGYSIALSDDTLAVGAFGESSATQGVGGNQDDTAESGAVYVFRYSGTAWQQEAYLKAFNAVVLQHFGEDVALSGDTLAVGAPLEGEGGAVHVFRRMGTAWQQEAHLRASNAEAEDHFGNAVALSGDTLAVGAIWEDSEARGVGGEQASNTAWESGAIYIFH